MPQRGVPTKGPMHDQIGVAPDWASEMSVVVLRETEVAQRLRRIARSFQTFEKADLERLFFRLAGQRSEQPLEFRAVCQVAGLVIVAEHELTIFGQFVRLGILVYAIDGGDGSVLEF